MRYCNCMLLYNWADRSADKENIAKMNDLLLYVRVVVKTANVVISRCFFAYDATE